jgi:hypothetical protein
MLENDLQQLQSIQQRSSFSINDDEWDKHQSLNSNKHHHSHNHNNNNNNKVKKSVQFAEYSELFNIPTVRELSKEEYNAVYLTRHDYKRIQCDNKRTIWMMNNGQFPDCDSQYFRGLEFGMTDYIMESKQVRTRTLHMILYAQRQHRRHHRRTHQLLDDPEWIERVYRKHTYNSRMMASYGGAYDAKAAAEAARC